MRVERGVYPEHGRIEPFSVPGKTILDSPAVRFLSSRGTDFYFWVDKNVLEKGHYDICQDNGWWVNRMCHLAYQARKAVPFAGILQEAGLFKPKELAHLALRYLTSKRENHIQVIHQDGVPFYALNLHLQEPSLLEAAEFLGKTEPNLNVILGNCSKGHLPNEVAGLDEIHVCPYRVIE